MFRARTVALAALAAAPRADAGPVPSYALTDLGVVTITGGGAIDINDAGQVTVNLSGTGYVWQGGVLSPPGGLRNNNVTFSINGAGNAVWTQDGRCSGTAGR